MSTPSVLLAARHAIDRAIVWLAIVLGVAVGHNAMYGPQAAYFSELFGAGVRYSGASLGYQLASVLSGAPAPFIATALLASYGSNAVAGYMALLAAVTVVAAYLAPETYRSNFDSTEQTATGCLSVNARPEGRAYMSDHVRRPASRRPELQVPGVREIRDWRIVPPWAAVICTSLRAAGNRSSPSIPWPSGSVPAHWRKWARKRAGAGCDASACSRTDDVARLEAVRVVTGSLKTAGIDLAVYDEVRVEPTDQSFQQAARFAKEGRFDGFVSVGGGSTIDTCKAANLYATYPAEFLAYVNAPIGDGRPVPGPLRPHIACPTTSGTGSESTGVAVFDLLSRHVKTGIAARALRPTLALIDPDVTRRCRQTSWRPADSTC